MDAQEFIFNTPLYTTVTYSSIVDGLIYDISNSKRNIIIDGYNSFQKKESTYTLKKGIANDKLFSYNSELLYKDGIREIILECGRYKDILYVYVNYEPSKNIITKIGQYPSVADIHIGQVKQYNKVLSQDKMREFTKAIGLAANGVGIGSFVYLRRIFENLIIEASEEAIKENEIEKDAFQNAHIDAKIGMLKDYLPAFLVENKKVYSILSSGIHELSEEECLSYFDCLRTSIELILDDKLEAFLKKQKENKAIQRKKRQK